MLQNLQVLPFDRSCSDPIDYVSLAAEEHYYQRYCGRHGGCHHQGIDAARLRRENLHPKLYREESAPGKEDKRSLVVIPGPDELQHGKRRDGRDN